MSKADWVWMPHPAHFICGQWCRFKLATYVNGFIVSTVGEYVPEESVREILARCRNIKLEGMGDSRLYDYMQKIGYEDLGLDRKYETMVFKAKKNESKEPDEQCCPYRIEADEQVDFDGYNSATDATKGHYELCEKYDGKKP